MSFALTDMTFTLVKWLADKRLSIIPASWIIELVTLPSKFPVEGICYWK